MFEPPKIVWLAFKLLNYAVLGILPYKTWKYLYDTYRENQKFSQEEETFKQRHDCVVTFSTGECHTGWYPAMETLNIKNIRIMYEPFLYFINTAKVSLDVAIMSINAQCIVDSLIDAHNRGVKVRVISNFYMSKQSYYHYKDMIRSGIQITFYVSKDKSNSIMHSKYIVKDFGAEDGNYLLTGSFNLTSGAFGYNYESVVFTSNKQMVCDFKKNFELMWNDFIQDNKQMFNRLVLENVGFPVDL